MLRDLEAGNKAAVNIYAEASGRDAASLRAAMDKESWYTGAEAVEAGLADEVIDDGVQVSMTSPRTSPTSCATECASPRVA